jgi:hypothetical protein
MGIHVLLMKEGCRDFMSGVSVALQTYYDDNIDIHHIFPQAYCGKNNIPRDLHNSIVASSGRKIPPLAKVPVTTRLLSNTNKRDNMSLKMKRTPGN